MTDALVDIEAKVVLVAVAVVVVAVAVAVLQILTTTTGAVDVVPEEDTLTRTKAVFHRPIMTDGTGTDHGQETGIQVVEKETGITKVTIVIERDRLTENILGLLNKGEIGADADIRHAVALHPKTFVESIISLLQAWP